MSARYSSFEGFGTPFTVEEVALPPLAEAETLVKIHCCALCRSDLHTFSGRREEPTPTILGHEAVGEVIASTAGLTTGTRVTWSIYAACGLCFYCAHQLPQKCERLFKYGHSRISETQPLSGGLASHILLRKGTQVIELSETVPDPIAALANCSTATACAAVRCTELAANSVVALFGAGILGLTCAAILSELGHRVIIFDPDQNKRELSLSFGGHCFESDPDRFEAEISRVTAGRGVEAALELSGSLTAAQNCLQITRIGGTVIWLGTVSPVGEVSLAPETIVRRQLTLKGIHNYSPQDLVAACDFLTEHHSEYPFSSLIGETFKLEDVQSAFLSAEKSSKRIIVVP